MGRFSNPMRNEGTIQVWAKPEERMRKLKVQYLDLYLRLIWIVDYSGP